MDCTSCSGITRDGQVWSWGGGPEAATGVPLDVVKEKFGPDWYTRAIRVDAGVHKTADSEQRWALRLIDAELKTGKAVQWAGKSCLRVH